MLFHLFCFVHPTKSKKLFLLSSSSANPKSKKLFVLLIPRIQNLHVPLFLENFSLFLSHIKNPQISKRRRENPKMFLYFSKPPNLQSHESYQSSFTKINQPTIQPNPWKSLRNRLWLDSAQRLNQPSKTQSIQGQRYLLSQSYSCFRQLVCK